MKQPEPLTGSSVVITRPIHQASSFRDKLESLGAQVLSIPSIRLTANLKDESFIATIRMLAEFDWIIFTSVNGVRAVLDQLKELNLDLANLFTPQLAAIGPATRDALLAAGAEEVTMPDEYVAEAIVPALGNISGKKILLPRANIARKDIIPLLERAGATVTQISVYCVETNNDTALLEKLENIPNSFVPDFLTFTSPSTFVGCQKLLSKAGKNWLQQSKIIAIGPITAKKIKELGFSTSATASKYTTDGLVDVLVDVSVNARSEHV